MRDTGSIAQITDRIDSNLVLPIQEYLGGVYYTQSLAGVYVANELLLRGASLAVGGALLCCIKLLLYVHYVAH